MNLKLIIKEKPMTKAITRIGVAMILASAVAARPAVANKKHSPEHEAAVRKCVEAYEAGAKAAHAPGSPTGAVRHRTMHRLAEEKKACVAKAPK